VRRFRVPTVLLLLALVATASTSGATLYRIRSGDNLTAIAHHFHMSVARLVAFNHLPAKGDLIYAGATLRIPGRATPRPASHPALRRHTVITTYVVRSGDSLLGVAARFHANAHRIATLNYLPRSRMILIGQRLRIPHVVVTKVATHRPSGAYQVGGRSPSRAETISVIRATARRWGVDPRLALAVGWQESGFSMRWVSATGAVGAMQVEPYTGVFLSNYVVHRRLNLHNLQDNATAGVALLAVLLRETHGKAGTAVAGYYQGLASVRSRGMYTDTKRYVANVLALRNRF
jgi:N-acetylmuramoyl-L-alanine amidase